MNNDEPNILDTANDTVRANREKYGPPNTHFDSVAQAWSAYLRAQKAQTLSARDVCNMLGLLKLIRDANGANIDNLIDVAGYALCAQMATPPEPVSPPVQAAPEMPVDLHPQVEKALEWPAIGSRWMFTTGDLFTVESCSHVGGVSRVHFKEASSPITLAYLYSAFARV
jgi:hypothetical protein